jgi:hypothetical protein
MNKIIWLAFLLAVSSSNATPPVAQVSMIADDWTFQYSANVPVSPSPAPVGWQFEFPSQNGVHYLVTRSPILKGKTSLILSGTVTVAPDATILHVPEPSSPSSNGPASCHVYFQEYGDNLSGRGRYAYYRWWSHADVITLVSGTFSITTGFDPSQWSSVFGEFANASAAARSGWGKALAKPQWIGITCGGGSFFGHGVYVSGGSATFAMTNFAVQ